MFTGSRLAGAQFDVTRDKLVAPCKERDAHIFIGYIWLWKTIKSGDAISRANAKQIATNRIKDCKNYRYFGYKKTDTHCALSVRQSLGLLVYPLPLLPFCGVNVHNELNVIIIIIVQQGR